MGYPALNSTKAKLAYAALSESLEPEWDALVSIRGGSGVDFDYDQIKSEVDELRQSLDAEMGRDELRHFEAELGIILHRSLRPSDAEDPDFWRWVALCLLREAVLDRHPSKDGKMPSMANFGIGGRVECFPYRAYLRADIGHRPEADLTDDSRYELARRGDDQDFWRSHLIRVRYPFYRPLAHALIEFQYPDDSGRAFLRTGDEGDGIRMLAKRLQRTHANMAYAVLSSDQCTCLIRRLANGLTKSDGTKFTADG